MPIMKPIIDLINAEADNIPSKSVAAKLKSWLPALALVPDNADIYKPDLERGLAQVKHETALVAKFACAYNGMTASCNLSGMKVKGITRDDWTYFQHLLANVRSPQHTQMCLHLPATFPEHQPWEMREARRFVSGEYEGVPWADDLAPIPGHYVHFSKKSTDGLVAYIQTPEKGEKDVQTPIKPGKYLKTYYPDLDVNVIRDYVAMCDSGNQLAFATTEEDIERVYMNGPPSCMVHPLNQFSKKPPVHPVRTYAGGDLALAYLRERSGKIVSRGLVWPEKKLMGRLYGDIERLQAALIKAGYTNRQNGGEGLTGAKLKAIPYKNKSDPTRDYIVMPYIDGSNMRRLKFLDGGSYFILGAKDGTDYNCGNTEGGMRLPAFRECPLSKGSYDLDKTPFVILEDTKQEVAKDPCVKGGLIFQCQKTQKYYSMAVDHGRVAVSWDKTKNTFTYEIWLADEVTKMTYVCAKTNERFSKQYMPPVILADGSKVSPSWFASQAPLKKAA